MKWSFVSQSDRFIEGVIKAVAEKDGDAYTPVYIHGSSYDVGALMHRFETEYARQNPGASICRISGNDFYNNCIFDASKTAYISRLCPNCDMLIFENIDAIAGSEKLMQLFCQLFDRVYDKGGKIIIGGLCRSCNIPALASRIRTELECGLVCNLAG